MREKLSSQHSTRMWLKRTHCQTSTGETLSCVFDLVAVYRSAVANDKLVHCSQKEPECDGGPDL